MVAATTLGALRINTSMENIDQLDQMKLLTEMTQQATELAGALQEERDRSAGPLTQDHPRMTTSSRRARRPSAPSTPSWTRPRRSRPATSPRPGCSPPSWTSSAS
ncbi:hypothetical protein NKH77_37030 [Streptomyces sp. M19]